MNHHRNPAKTINPTKATGTGQDEDGHPGQGIVAALLISAWIGLTAYFVI